MTKNGLNIQTISTKWTAFKPDRVLLSRQVTEKKKKAYPSNFLKYLFASRTNGTFGFVRHSSPLHKAKKAIFYQHT